MYIVIRLWSGFGPAISFACVVPPIGGAALLCFSHGVGTAMVPRVASSLDNSCLGGLASLVGTGPLAGGQSRLWGLRDLDPGPCVFQMASSCHWCSYHQQHTKDLRVLWVPTYFATGIGVGWGGQQCTYGSE